MILRVSLLVIFLISSLNAYSQKDSIFEKEIMANDFKIRLKNNPTSFFTGSILVTDRYSNSLFEADSVFTGFNRDTLIDLNNDGTDELILDLGTGATMYNYNMYLIFDFSKVKIEPFEVHNADLLADVNKIPKIVSSVRLSPAYLGAGYSCSYTYENGTLILETDPNTSSVLKNLTPSDDDYIELMDRFKSGSEECKDGKMYSVYFEGYIMQMKILNNESKGWEFFDKYYQCNDKKEVRADLKKKVDSTYDYLVNANLSFYSVNKP